MNGLGQDPKRPIARTAFELESDEFWTVWSEAFLGTLSTHHLMIKHLRRTFSAHLEYFQSGTLHGNINPYVIFADSQTGRGFLADYEYSTNVIAPNGYIPLAVVQVSQASEPLRAPNTKMLLSILRSRGHRSQSYIKRRGRTKRGGKKASRKQARKEPWQIGLEVVMMGRSALSKAHRSLPRASSTSRISLTLMPRLAVRRTEAKQRAHWFLQTNSLCLKY